MAAFRDHRPRAPAVPNLRCPSLVLVFVFILLLVLVFVFIFIFIFVLTPALALVFVLPVLVAVFVLFLVIVLEPVRRRRGRWCWERGYRGWRRSSGDRERHRARPVARRTACRDAPPARCITSRAPGVPLDPGSICRQTRVGHPPVVLRAHHLNLVA